MPRKILIVDDVAINRHILRGALGREYDVLEAENGEEALAAMNRGYKMLSAILLDLMMPVMDGFEVLRRMRDNVALSQIPVIVVTGTGDEDTRLRALALGANDFVTKPYNPDIIRHCLRNNISMRESASIVNALQRDKLTGLYTRDAFFEKTAVLIRDREPGSYIMSCFDIRNFKLINDQYGADEGDRILHYIGKSVQRDMAEIGGIGSRIAADNFAVLYPAENSGTDFVTRIQNNDATPQILRAATAFSVGRYTVADLSLSASAIYDRAYIAKQSVKGRYDTHIAYFDETMRDRLLREQEIVSEMDSALTLRQFEVWFQPQYNHVTGALIGAEALVRWRHPARGLVAPEDFVPVFEQNGFVYELDKYVWETTCALLRKWLDAGRNPLPVAVNISRYDIFKPDLFEVITGLLKKYALPVELLRLEITESAFADSADQIIEMVRRLIDYGFTVEIDDFGSGYSSLNTLKDVPAQVLKLDMRFLENDSNSQRGGNILESVVRMAKWLGMSVIAEGVETNRQADFLKSIGCSYMQGFLYARPMPMADYETLAQNAGKEQRLLALETVENLDNNAFWDPESMETLIFNSYVGGACIFEYHNGSIEMLRATDKFARVLGGENITVEDVLKLDWVARLSPESQAAVIAALERSIATGEEVSGEYVFQALPGCPAETYLRSTMRVIAAADRRYLVYSTSENITAQRQAEQKERETEQKRLEAAEQLRAIMDNINGGVTAITLEDDAVRFLFANDEYYAQLGYTREQFAAEVANPFALVYVEDRARVQAETQRASVEQRPFTIEYRAVRRDGVLCWLRSNISITRFPDVSAPVQLAVANDITQLQEATERLRISEEENRLGVLHTGNTVCRYIVADRSLIIPPETDARFALPERLEDVPYAPVRRGNISPETAEAYVAFYESILHGEKSGAMTYQRRAGESWRWLSARFTTIFSDEGEPVSAVVSFNDVTEQMEKEAVFKKWQQSLQEKSLNSYTLFRCNISKNASFDSREGSLLRIDFSDDARTFQERAAEYLEQYVFEDDRQQYAAFVNSDAMLAAYYRGKRSDTLDYREQLPEGGTRWLRLSVDLVEYPNSTDVEAYLLYENIDDNKRAELLTIERAQTDPLTGVLNRVTFAGEVDRIIRAAKPNTRHALLMLDIDGFKMVNDAFGHGAGDQTLIDVADAMRAALRRGDLLGRLGGDEFLVFLNDIPNDAIAAKKAVQICALCRKSFSLEVQISGSVGIAIGPRDGRDFEALYKKADAALYHVKGAGKNDYAFYQEEMDGEHLALEREKVVGAAVPAGTKKRRMLIVDDNKLDYELLSNMFRDEFIIEKAKDGNLALIRLRHYGSAISVVLLDLMMPGMDGFAVLEKMQASPELQSIPVVVVSGDGERGTSLRAIRGGASDFVTKPVDAELLRIRVFSAISKAENERLRAQNSFLEMQSNEVLRYKTVLDRTGTVVIELDWVRGTFAYDPAVSAQLAGLYDDRKLWHILLSDLVADVATVKKMQELTYAVAEDRKRQEGSAAVQLRTASGAKHWFRMNIYKQANEYQLTEKLILTFNDLGAEPEMQPDAPAETGQAE